MAHNRNADTPLVAVTAGPNGAGKSTMAPRLLQGAYAVSEFVNADVIAQGLSAFQPESAAIAAGRIMLARLQALAEARVDFAFETTLASRTFAPRLTTLRASGYRAHLAFLSVPSPDLSVQRVADRVRRGGHAVPKDVVRRHYAARLRNFFTLYQQLFDTWQMYDNSPNGAPALLASGGAGRPTAIRNIEGWENLIGRQR